jgi:hypothetical protein
MLNLRLLLIVSTAFFTVKSFGQTFRTFTHKKVEVFYYSTVESEYKFTTVKDEVGNYVIREDMGDYTNYKRMFTMLSNTKETIKNKQWYSVVSENGIIKNTDGTFSRKSTCVDGITKIDVTIYELTDKSKFSILNMIDNVIITYYN